MPTNAVSATELLAAQSALAACIAEDAPESVSACMDATLAFFGDVSATTVLHAPGPQHY